MASALRGQRSRNHSGVRMIRANYCLRLRTLLRGEIDGKDCNTSYLAWSKPLIKKVFGMEKTTLTAEHAVAWQALLI